MHPMRLASLSPARGTAGSSHTRERNTQGPPCRQPTDPVIGSLFSSFLPRQLSCPLGLLSWWRWGGDPTTGDDPPVPSWTYSVGPSPGRGYGGDSNRAHSLGGKHPRLPALTVAHGEHGRRCRSRTQVPSRPRAVGWRMLPRCRCRSGHNRGSDLISGPGTPCAVGQLNQKKGKTKKSHIHPLPF